MYAAGMKIEEIETVLAGLDTGDIWKLLSDPAWGSGLVKGEKLMDFLEKYIGGLRIEDLKIPFCAVATDIKTAEKVILNKGELIPAIRASCSIPLIFEPFLLNGKIMVDGGVSSPVPVPEVRIMGAEKVIAVNLDAIYFLEENKKVGEELNTFSVLNNSYQILRYHLAKMEMVGADIILEPNAMYVHDFDFGHTHEYLNGGFDIVLRNKEKILDSIN